MKIFPDYLPSAFGVLLLTFTFICLVAPYASGHDFGIFRIPNFSPPTQRLLKWLAPPLFVVIVLAHLPILPHTCYEPIVELVTDIEQCGSTKEEIVTEPPRPKKCRDEAFGLEGWRYTEEISANSGWRGGGHSRGEWCQEMIAGFLQGRNIGSSHNSEVLSTDEDSRWSGTFGRTRQYNYTCTAKISWEPIFREKVDANVCGMVPAQKGIQTVAATCEVESGRRQVDCDV